MRLKTVLTTLFVALMLIVGADYAAFAATGKSMMLGEANKSGKVTTIKRTKPGPALKLKVKPQSQAPLVTNGRGKVQNLNADLIDGIDSSQLAGRSSVTVFDAPGCQSLVTVTGVPAKLADLGTFVSTGHPFTEVDFAAALTVGSMAGTGVVYELRIDDQSSAQGELTTLLRESGVDIPATISGVFSGLAPGSHTVSLWVQGVNGNASNVRYDSGCFGAYGVNRVTVKQFD